MKWEYKTDKLTANYYYPGGDDEDKYLQKQGSYGWILCGPPLLYSSEWTYYWKRQVTVLTEEE